jgi:hypothetical protein
MGFRTLLVGILPNMDSIPSDLAIIYSGIINLVRPLASCDPWCLGPESSMEDTMAVENPSKSEKI